jgi:carboxypeptidase Q
MTSARRVAAVLLSSAFAFTQGFAQGEPRPTEPFDSAAVARIIDEGMNRSTVMDILSWLTDVCGPRLTASPGYKRSMEWTQKTMKTWGLENIHVEGFGPWGRGWSIKRFTASMIEPDVTPLIAYPKAWSPGSGSVKAEVVFLDAKKDSTLASYRGHLKGKIVFLSDPREIKPHFEPEATRLADSSLLKLANADVERRRRRRFDFPRDFRRAAALQYAKMKLCTDENAAMIVTTSDGDDGTLFVQSASPLWPPDSSYMRRPSVYAPDPPEMLPQVVIAPEHYNRIVRILDRGVPVKLDIAFDVRTTEEDSAYNVIAEIPGTDLKDEVVMIGGHLDSWHAGTGATDDGTGVAACMEAMRILKVLGLKPRRTIRIGLWAAEEQGLLGSEAYVQRHFGERPNPSDTSRPQAALKPEAEKFSVYFNHDNGTGKFRGVYMQGNEAVRPIFRAWLAPFAGTGAQTLTPSNTGGTDHLSFTAVGLPGFQFIQDDIDYDTRTHHSNMDVYDRVQPEDMKQAATILAAFAYNAAMRDQKIPRKP